MKNLNFLITLFLFSTFTAFTQIEYYDCVTLEGNTPDPSLYSHSIDPNFIGSTAPVVLNVYYWQLLEPDGSYGWGDFSEAKLLENIALLNIVYNPYNIFFKYRGYESVVTPADLTLREYVWDDIEQRYVCNTINGEYDPDGYGIIGRCQVSQFFSYAYSNHRRVDAINIYVPYGSEFGGAARSVGSNMTVLKISKLNKPTAIHELGHNLGLYHTCSKTNTCQNNEHTTREEFLPDGVTPNPDFNADTADDEVVDTAANSGYRFVDSNGESYYPFINEENCTYFGEEQDELNVTFQIYHEDVINVMSNAYICVESSLTNGQVIRMHETIATDSDLIPTITEVSSLYEPYSGEYINGVSIALTSPRFQPGFDYTFLR